MARALLDGRQRGRQALVLAAAQQLRAGVRERGDRRQRVVELVADHADHFLPGLHFLPPQLGGELAQQHKLVLAAVEAEAAPAQGVDVFLVLVADGEHAVRSEEHTSELQSLMRISYAVFFMKKKRIINSYTFFLFHRLI